MKRLSGKQRVFVDRLISQVGEDAARNIGYTKLGRDIFAEVASFPSAPWRTEQAKDHLSVDEARRLINGLLDYAGRTGRRKNNRRAS